MDFLLPLWAAADLGATPAAIGLVVAIEAGTSLAVRRVAGVLADRANRQVVAAVGASLYAAAFVVYARLLSSEQAGSLAAFVIGLSLLGSIGYRPLFLVGAAACGAAMVLLLGGRGTAGPRWRDGLDGRAGLRHVGGRLAPLLAVTALTAGAEDF